MLELAQTATATFPLVTNVWGKIAVIALAYAAGLRFSGPLVLHFVTPPGRVMIGGPPADACGLDHAIARGRASLLPRPRYDAGAIIGKCENILTITLVLAGQFGGLGLIFTAKALARSDDIKRNASWFLGGTLINLVWGLAVGTLAKLIAIGV